jgi:hypothetical protein
LVSVDNRRLARLQRLNPTVVFLVALAVAVVAFLTQGVIGALLLLAIVGGLAWLLLRTWRVTPGPMRVLRLLVLLGLLFIALVKIV